MEDSKHIKVGNKLKKLRIKYGYSQKQIADYLDIDQSTISKIESGDRNLKASSIEKLTYLYNCDVLYLLGEYDDFNFIKMEFKKADIDLNVVASMNKLCNNIVLLRNLKGEKDGKTSNRK